MQMSHCDEFLAMPDRGRRMKSAKLFPMFLKIAGQPCLVVGAGAVAESKIASLVEAGAKVRVIAPAATKQIRLWAEEKKIEWQRRRLQPEDLAGMFLVVAATSSRELHEEIFQEARRRGVLCNIVDVPELCDFYYPAVVQRGALQIAISTSGRSPALAQRLRKELEKQFGPEYEEWMEQLGDSRDEHQAGDSDPEERKQLRHEQASEEAFETFLRKHKKSKRAK
jgi:precorrin-2 dehydrogenase/sirohydrochlorin ferrochelatase